MARRAFTVNFVGDVMLGRLIDQLFPVHVKEPTEAKHIASFVKSNPDLKNYGPQSPWGTALPLFQDSDLNLINLETSATTSNRKWPDKVFNYRMHPKNIQALHQAKIDYASLANNHTLDFSEQGLADTLSTLKDANVLFAGAGFNAEEASRPAILQLPRSPSRESQDHQHKIAIWSAADHPMEWASVSGFNLIDYSTKTRARLKEAIRRTTPDEVSLKIFSVHWGPNYSWRPASEIQSLAHFLIDDCGIDIIHGHSSHHIQGVEIYNGKLIIYGCGDFVDDYALTPEYRNDISAVWRVRLVEQGDQLKLGELEAFPTKIKRFQAHRLSRGEADYDWVSAKFKALCEEFGTTVKDGSSDNHRLVVPL